MAEPADRTDLTAKPSKKPETKSAGYWRKEIARSRKSWGEYRKRARKVVERYRDEREESELKGSRVRFNILYSNIETLRPAIYSQVPNPDVRRRFLAKDPIGRVSADVLQKALAYLDEADLGSTLSACVQDYVLPGFAVARVRYAPVMDGDTVLDEDAPTEYVGWDHFACSRSPSWERTWWVGFMEELTKDEFIAAFGEKAVDKASFSYRNGEDDKTDGAEGDEGTGGKARVWEVWDKRAKQRFFVAEGGDGFVRDPEPDPLGLKDFYPCPKPLWAISTTGSLIPVPEYLEYQDLALELDDVTQRIHVLTGALRRRGFYDGSLKDHIANVGTMADNQFLPVEDWARLTDKGGLANIVAEMPLDGIVKALTSLYDYRERIIQTIYQVTGMADIVRGASDPNETATAQQIKGRYAGLRLGEKQKRFQEFARDLLRLKAEIVAEHFQVSTLAQISGVELLTGQQKQAFQQAQAQLQQQAQMMQQQGQQGQQPQMPPELAKMAPLMKEPTWEEVIQVLRSDKLRGFRVDIETDSTVQPDADEERGQRVELLKSLTGFLAQTAPLVQQGLLSADLVRELTMFGIRAFKTAPQVEAALDQVGVQGPEPAAVTQAKQQIQQAQQELQKREEAVRKAELSVAKGQADAQLAAERAMRQESEAGWAKRMLEMTQSFIQKLDALEAKHDGELRKVAEQADGAVAKIIGEIEQLPFSAPDAAKMVKGPRAMRVRVMDHPDGSISVEEMPMEDEIPEGAE